MSQNWQVQNLGDVITLHRGYDLPSRERERGSIPIVSSSGITGFHIEAKIKSPGVVTGRYGTLGQVFYLKKDFWPLNTTLYVSDFKGNEPQFISYFLENIHLDQYSSAAAVPGLDRNALHLLPIKIPQVSIQKKIASILANYDDLIENNTRRIRILEEMAQTIYREWFVTFRFPGHEGVRMVESSAGRIPEGWTVKSLGEIIELAYGKGLKAETRKLGKIPVYGSAGVVGFHDESLVNGPGIIVGRKGNVGIVFWTYENFYPIDTVFYVKTMLPLHYVYFNLQTQNFINNDAAVPGLSRNQAYLLPFLLPQLGLLKNFSNIIDPMFKEVYILQKKNGNLRKQRDLLLPRLVSGELDVEQLEFP